MDRNRIDELADDFLDREERERHSRELDDPSGWDSAMATVEIASEVVPGLGPLIGAVITRVVPRRRAARRLTFLRELNTAISRLQDRIDKDLVAREEFADLVEEILEQVDRRQTEGKQAAYAAALANSLTAESPEAIDQGKMIAALGDLRPAHLRMIAVLRNERIPDTEVPMVKQMIPILGPRLPGMTREQVINHFADLQRHGIVPTFADPPRPGDIRELANHMTEFGRRFAEWIAVG